MTLKKIIFVFILLCVIAVLILFFTKPPTNNTKDNRATTSRVTLSQIFSRDIGSEIYRLSCQNDSLVISAVGNKYFVTSKDSFEPRQLAANEYYYNIFLARDTVLGIALSSSKFNITTKDTGFTGILPNLIGQSLYQNGNIVFVSKGETIQVPESVFISQLRGLHGKPDHLIYFNDFLKSYLLPAQDCLSSMTEGSFFEISNNSWGYLFYYGGYFITFTDGKAKLHQTVDESPFKKFINKKIKVGAEEFTACQPENDNFVNFHAACNKTNLFILPAVISRQGNQHMFIDVYDKITFDYEYSIELPLAHKNQTFIELSVIDNTLYLATTENELIAFKMVSK